MKTIIFDPNTGQIKVILDGPSVLHGKTIEDFAGLEVIEHQGSIKHKKPVFIDGAWQIVDDEQKILESHKDTKNRDIEGNKENALLGGLDIDGELMIDGSWSPDVISVYFFGKDNAIIGKHIRAYSAISLLPPASRAQRFLKGRQEYKVLLGKRRIVFNNFNDFESFIQSYQEKIELADTIETEKKEAVLMAQTVEDLDLIDETSGWEELNG